MDVANIFHAAVHHGTADAYSPEQLEAWAPSPIDYESWRWRCELKRPFLFIVHARVVGFLELDPDGHIDCHYVDPVHARQGYGAKLLQHAVVVAQRAGLPRLYVEASHVAKGVYLKASFKVLRQNTVVRRGVELTNWAMQKHLTHAR
jgi:putative acetyltransferase